MLGKVSAPAPPPAPPALRGPANGAEGRPRSSAGRRHGSRARRAQPHRLRRPGRRPCTPARRNGPRRQRRTRRGRARARMRPRRRRRSAATTPSAAAPWPATPIWPRCRRPPSALSPSAAGSRTRVLPGGRPPGRHAAQTFGEPPRVCQPLAVATPADMPSPSAAWPVGPRRTAAPRPHRRPVGRSPTPPWSRNHSSADKGAAAALADTSRCPSNKQAWPEVSWPPAAPAPQDPLQARRQTPSTAAASSLSQQRRRPRHSRPAPGRPPQGRRCA
mmetsp:Transcript_113806/g.361709  ORF Transcript_113806/g.361709 Transcript_113806/m.361709 type:complete len:274 (+) Transcript_113806:207-1028(+)